MHRKTHAVIYLSRIKNNLEQLKLQSGAKELCMMVKANAYGHGAGTVAKSVEDFVDRFGVISIEEAQILREQGVKKDILLFSNLWEDSISELERLNITPVIGSFYSLECLIKSNSNIPFHIKLNTGMNRFGFQASEIAELNLKIKNLHHRVAGLCSHLIAGGDYLEEQGHTAKQRECLKTIFKELEVSSQCHFYKSAPPLLCVAGDGNKDEMMNSIRPGIACYGIKPDIDFKPKWSMEPALELKSVVAAVQHISSGSSVSYSASWVAKRDSKIAVIQIGYADGLPRCLSNKLSVLIGGKLLPQVGNICMDYCMIDCTDLGREPIPGEEVVLYGRQGDAFQEIEFVAKQAGTIPYELLTSISSRVRRVYVE